MNFLRTKSTPPPAIPKLMGILTAIGVTPWIPIDWVPNGFYAQLFGTSGALTATAHFEFSNDGQNLAALEGTTLSLSGTGAGASVVAAALGAQTMHPMIPWKYVRLNVTAISGIGASVSGFQCLGN